ncbi:MAG: capsid protein [Leptospiraceae bacterium]|nr:capsid protein [Spirochaetaceae bacterium]|tara:strand:- start:2077 stop:3498 length:1422 start_codon:yes stop_codon:yes gene_type:complete
MRELNELLEIKKAFEANPGITDVAELFDGPALSMQYIDGTMSSIVASDVDFAFLNKLPKRSVDQTIAEYNKMKSHGDSPYRTSFVGQSEDPHFADAYLKRKFDEMAYLSEGFTYNRVIARTRNTNDPEMVSSTSAMRRMLTSLSRGLWNGDRDALSVEMDGIVKKVSSLGSDFVYDCRGQLPGADVIQHFAAQIRSRYFGLANEFHMAVGSKNLFDQADLGDKQYIFLDGQNTGAGLYASRVVEGQKASFALNNKIQYVPDLWIDESNFGVPMDYDRSTDSVVEKAVGEAPPDTPALAVAAQAPSVPGSKWEAGDVGTVAYRVAAVGPKGASQATTSQSATVAANGAVELTITPAAGGNFAEAFLIFRETAPGNGDFRKIARVKRATSGDTTFVDVNETIPGTSVGVLGDFNSRSTSDETRTMVLSELMSPLKTTFPPGVGGLRLNVGMVEYFTTIQLFAEEKFVVFKNMPVI